MTNLTYVTGNYGKYVSVKKHFNDHNLDINYFTCDLEEPEINDIEVISKAKAISAYKMLNKPCFVADSGFYIEDYPNNPGYPGAFVKRSGVSSDIDSLLDKMKNVVNRGCKFVDCLTFYDGNEFYTFYGVSHGTLACDKRGATLAHAKSNLWSVFVPDNCDKTLAEMDDDERENRNDGHTSATETFIKWYKDVYLKQSIKRLV